MKDITKALGTLDQQNFFYMKNPGMDATILPHYNTQKNLSREYVASTKKSGKSWHKTKRNTQLTKIYLPSVKIGGSLYTRYSNFVRHLVARSGFRWVGKNRR